MSRDQWRDEEGYLDVVRVILDTISEIVPDSVTMPDLPPEGKLEKLKKPLITASDILPATVRVPWGSGMRIGAVGFDVDVFAKTRTVGTQLALHLVRILPERLLRDPGSGVVAARIPSDPTVRPWSELAFHRRGFELEVEYHDKG